MLWPACALAWLHAMPPQGDVIIERDLGQGELVVGLSRESGERSARAAVSGSARSLLPTVGEVVASGDDVLLGPFGVAIDLFQAGDPPHDFVNAIDVQTLHALGHRQLADFGAGHVLKNQLAYLGINEH